MTGGGGEDSETHKSLCEFHSGIKYGFTYMTRYIKMFE